MNEEIAGKILSKIYPLIGLDFAILDENGKVIAKSSGFEEKEKMDLKNPNQIVPLNYKGEKAGYIVFDQPGDKIKSIKKILKSMAELYLDQLLFLSDIPNAERHIDKFVYDLLNGSLPEDSLAAQGRAFGYDLNKPRVAIVLIVGGHAKEIFGGIDIKGEEKEDQILSLKRKISSSINSFYTRHKENIIAYVGENVFVILKDVGGLDLLEENLKHFKETVNSIHYIVRNEVRTPVTIGVGGYYDGISGLKQSFGEAMLTARLGEQVWGEDKIYHFDSFGVVAPLVQGVDKVRENYSNDLFSKFSNKEETLKSLNTFFDSDMSLTKTATKLKIHRNTLVYRLDKINEIIGLDPRMFEDAVQIKLALLFSNFLTGEKV